MKKKLPPLKTYPYRRRKVITYCNWCKNYEYAEEAGSLFYKCTECTTLIPKGLR